MADAAPEQNRDDAGAQQAVPETVFIALKSIPQRSYARDLRLREADVIAAAITSSSRNLRSRA